MERLARHKRSTLFSEEKIVRIMTPGVHDMKMIFFVTLWRIKLKCLLLTSRFRIVLYYRLILNIGYCKSAQIDFEQYNALKFG